MDAPARNEALMQLIAAGHRGVLTTQKRDGRPQLSNISYGYFAGPDLLKVSITADRAKYHNLRRDPRASLYVTSPDFWAYAVAEGDAELSPVAAAADDDTVAELVELYRVINGEHPDWDDYRRAMVADRRAVVRLAVSRVYGQPPQ
jgi:PPOX class probable F420-dependent enzyme